MPTRKKAPRKASVKNRLSAARPTTGSVPPYGEAIHQAVARGELREMKAMAANARKWIKDTQDALAKLEATLKKAGG